MVASKPRTDGNYLAFEVVGDSMDDGSDQAIKEKDVVVARELYEIHWRNRLHLPKVFVIVLRNDGILIKLVTAHDTVKGMITCHSLNNYYDDQVIDLKNVVKLYYVKEVRREYI